MGESGDSRRVASPSATRSERDAGAAFPGGW